jgi:hypothetical protein
MEETVQQQMDQLTRFLESEFRIELQPGDSPADAAMRILRRQRQSIETLTTAINLACPGALT